MTTLAGPMRSPSSVPGLVVSISAEGAVTVIALRGEADVSTLAAVADGLSRALADHRGAVVVDLTDTEFIDSATVRAIGQAAQFLGGRERQLTVRSPSRLALHLLEVFGLSDLVEHRGMAVS